MFPEQPRACSCRAEDCKILLLWDRYVYMRWGAYRDLRRQHVDSATVLLELGFVLTRVLTSVYLCFPKDCKLRDVFSLTSLSGSTWWRKHAMKHVCALICFILAAASLQQAQGRAARTLLQTASSEADAAAWVTANLTGPSLNVQAASTSVAQAASSAKSSGSSSSTALASAFVNVLLSGGETSVGNATATAFSQALSSTKGDAGSQQVIAQAYTSAVLSLHRDNQVQVTCNMAFT